MTNTERIQANNAELRECIEIAEKIPDAGGVAEPIDSETDPTMATEADYQAALREMGVEA